LIAVAAASISPMSSAGTYRVTDTVFGPSVLIGVL
jgi:hypothetical protein